MNNPYETPEIVAQYLLFHYGPPEINLPWQFGPQEALDFPKRIVDQITAHPSTGERRSALDLGCAVGRSSFELSRFCKKVLGVDFSHAFVDVAQRLASGREVPYAIIEEGDSKLELQAALPEGVRPERVQFRQGDAVRPNPEWGRFDLVLLANLLCRVPDPARCLIEVGKLIEPGGLLAITSPATWLEEYTPRERWLARHGRETLQGITDLLEPRFHLLETLDIPFLIREHRRKFQWSVAQFTLWEATS